MDVTRLKRELQTALKELRRQRDELETQISGVENALNSLTGKKPRAKATGGGSGTRKKPHWSPEARRAAAERMRKYWAGQKKPAPVKKKRTSSKSKGE